jgi:hypothetical protein
MVVEQHQSGRTGPRDGSGERLANRAARTGYQHAMTRQPGRGLRWRLA